jgi:aspartate aminotransferase-like enzyme
MSLRLFTPGPVTVPDEILRALAHQPLHHRSSEFLTLSRSVWSDLQQVFRTDDPVVLLAGSGMTGIEAAMVSVHRPGDHVAILEHGRFGQRLTEIAQIYGLIPHPLRVAWGEVITSEMVAEHLGTRDDWSGVWFVHAETSTGVVLDAASITSAIRAVAPDIVVGMDAVLSIGIEEVNVAAWTVDIAVCGIQKGLMCPPGLACVSISERAEHHILAAGRRSYTLDLHTVLDHQREGLFAWTPPVTLVSALHVALQRILREGLEHVWHRHQTSAEIVRTGLRDLGLKIFGAATSHAVTVVEHHRSTEIRRALEDAHRILVASGQDQFSGRMFRVGTCGAVTPDDARDIVDAIHSVLTHL